MWWQWACNEHIRVLVDLLTDKITDKYCSQRLVLEGGRTDWDNLMNRTRITYRTGIMW